MTDSIVPLHVRSGYSLTRGTAMPGRLVELAASMGYARLAMTDVNNLCGATVFHKAAEAAGLGPIIGAELSQCGTGNGGQGFDRLPPSSPPYVVALVASDVGYENLCRLITRRHVPEIDEGATHKQSEAKLVGGEEPGGRGSGGHSPPYVESGDGQGDSRGGAPAFAETTADKPVPPRSQRDVQEVAGQSPYMLGGHSPPYVESGGGHSPPYLPSDAAELQDGLHFIVEDAGLARAMIDARLSRDRLWLGVDPATQSHRRLGLLADSARKLNLPLVATGKALLAEPGDYELARLLTAIRLGAVYDALPADALPHQQPHLRPPQRLRQELADMPQAVRNNQRLAEMCGGFRLLPRRPVFPRYPCPKSADPAAYLRVLCRRGLRRRYGRCPSEGAEARLSRELGPIERMGFAEYFLLIREIVRYARSRNTPVAGRGSGAGSIVAYALGITNVCPIRYDIPFERFLHEGREDFPDLDIDFCWRTRDDVIDYVFRRWGESRVAMVCTHNTFQERSAIREAAKAFGFSEEQISNAEAMEADPRLARIAALARRLVGLPHLLSVHPGGIVMGRKPIDRYAPIQRAAKGVTITQYDKDGVEDIGLVKLDLLGNRNLSTVRAACDLTAEHTGRRVNIEAVPENDAATIRLLCDADSVGCNQLESPAMRNLLRMMQPAGTDDVMQALALIRPGAASIGMKETFIRRRRSLEAVPTGQAQVDALLRCTHGVMMYEDDVMMVAAALTGGTLSQADRFRKAIQKCTSDAERLELSRRFLARCRENGVDLDYAKGLWVQMAKFNAYSFCRAHAASYAAIAYAGAYLKTHHPLEFWTAALNNNQGMYHPRVYVECAKRDGIAFQLPDVNRSGEEFTIDDGAIRVGLNFVAGLGPVTIERILRSRRDGPFDGLSEFLMRTGTPTEEARSLVLCGAFDWTGRTRPTLMMELNLFGKIGPRCATSQRGLLPAVPIIPNIPGDYDDGRKYLDERAVLGISVREHPMAFHRARRSELPEMVDADSRDLPRCIGRTVRLAGVIEAQRRTSTQRGGQMLFLTMDDEFGLFEVTVFPGALGRNRTRLTHYGPYLVTGTVEEQYGAITVSAGKISLVGEVKPGRERETVGEMMNAE
ncbi:MAG TPA: PHP domain-containing protein [Phycisphaerae bacterium]|nr:PHP domain-containing protein [Phycisphaerae bacterium]